MPHRPYIHLIRNHSTSSINLAATDSLVSNMKSISSFIALASFLAYLHNPATLALTLPPPKGISAPRPPSGFRTQIHYNPDRHLINPISLYVCAIQALVTWSDAPWDSIIPNAMVLVIPELNVGMNVVTTAPIGAVSELRLSFVLLGLVQTVRKLTEENRFEAVEVGLYKGDVGTGVLSVYPPRREGSRSSSSRRDLSAPNVVNSSLSAHGRGYSGHFVHPQFPWLILDWTFDGRRIRASEIFTTIIDAIICTADEPASAERSYIHGVGLLGDTAMNLHAVNGFPLSNQGIRKILLMVAKEAFVRERRFEELDFTFSERGRVSAEGFFIKMGRM